MHSTHTRSVQVYMELLQDLLRPESAVQLREHPESGVFLEGVAWRSMATVGRAGSGRAGSGRADLPRSELVSHLRTAAL